MKGALAVMIYAAANADRSKLKVKVAVSATVLEEVLEDIFFKLITDESA